MACGWGHTYVLYHIHVHVYGIWADHSLWSYFLRVMDNVVIGALTTCTVCNIISNLVSSQFILFAYPG